MSRTCLSNLQDHCRRGRGATMVEYALLLALIAMVVIVGARVVGLHCLSALNYAGMGLEIHSAGGGTGPD